MLIINFEGREAKGLSKGRYDETFAVEDEQFTARSDLFLNLFNVLTCLWNQNLLIFSIAGFFIQKISLIIPQWH